MLKRAAKKIHRIINPQFESIEDNTWENMNELSKKAAPLRVGQEKMDETLYVLHQLKNSETVKTSEFEALTRIFTGQKVYVDTRDLSVAPHLMLDGVWEPGITTVFQNTIREGDTVLDIGANFGYFGLIAGAETKDKGRVFFLEANPTLCSYIKKSAMLNGMAKNSVVSNLAISNKKESVKLNILKDSWGSSSLMDAEVMSKSDGVKYEVESVIDVSALTIDEYCKNQKIESVDVIKLDIEGFEPQAFAGMSAVIRKNNDLKMFVEFAPNRYQDPKKFFNSMLKSFPYVYGINDHDGGTVRISTYDDFLANARNDWLMLLFSKKACVGL